MAEHEKIFDPEKAVGDRYRGKFTDANFVIEEDRNGNQAEYLRLMIKKEFLEEPTSFPRMKYSERKNSIYMNFLQALQKCGVGIRSEKDLIGEEFLFERKDLQLGPEIVIEDFPLPIEYIESKGKKETSEE